MNLSFHILSNARSHTSGESNGGRVKMFFNGEYSLVTLVGGLKPFQNYELLVNWDWDVFPKRPWEIPVNGPCRAKHHPGFWYPNLASRVG